MDIRRGSGTLRHAAILLAATWCAYADTVRDSISGDSSRISSDNAVPDTTQISDSPATDRMHVRGVRPAGSDESSRPTIVSGNRIRETTRLTPLEALSQESGSIYVTGRGAGLHGVAAGASGGIYIRGLGGSPNAQVLMVEDGAPDYQGIFGHPIPDAFSPALIDRVVVIKGGDGVRYGTNAMGGVVVTETRWPESPGFTLENDAAYGSYNTFRDRITVFSRKDRSEFAGAFSAQTSDGHRGGIGETAAGGRSVAGQANARFALSDRWTLSFRDKIVNLQGADPGTKDHAKSGRWFDVMRNTAGARLLMDGENAHLSIVPWANVGVHRLFDGFYSRDYTGGIIGEVSSSVLGDRIGLIAGAAGEHVDGLVLNRTTGVYRDVEPYSSAGIYGQSTVKPGGGVTGVCGARLHYNTTYGTVPMYKAGLDWSPVDFFSLHTRLTKNFRQPTFRELYLPFPAANPSLKPETSLNWDGGIDLSFGPVHAKATVYRTYARNLIRYFNVWPSASVLNIDRIEIWGVEGNLRLHGPGPFALHLTACRQDVGRFTKQNPDAKVNFRLESGHDRTIGRLEWSLAGEWVGGLYSENYRLDEYRMDDVFFVDASLRLRSSLRSGVVVEPYLIVRNLLNCRYEYIRNYPMPGLNFLAGLVLKV